MVDIDYAFAGSGIANLVYAIYLTKYKNIDPKKIIILEKGEQTGGLYMPWYSKELGYLDKGMHIYYECGYQDIDSIVYESMREDEWILLEGNSKDIAGAFFRNKLQTNSPYPDLSEENDETKAKYLYDIVKAYGNILRKKARSNSSTCKDYWEKKFGNSLTNDIFDPICKKLYGLDSSKLSKEAAHITKLDRVILFGEEIMKELGNSEGLRNSIAYPEQMNMPRYRKWEQKGYYPKKGMSELVRRLTNILINLGVRFCFGAYIQKISNSSGKGIFIDVLSTSQQGTVSVNKLTSKFLIWAAGQKQLQNICEEEIMSDLEYRSNVKKQEKGMSAFVYHRSKAANWNFGNLYYLYSYDDTNNAFRVTNLSSYSKRNQARLGEHTFCTEYHLNSNQIKNLSRHMPINKKDMVNLSCSELKAMGILSTFEQVKSDALVFPTRIFPVPRVEPHELSTLPHWMNDKIIYSGKNEESPPFFLVDVLKSLYLQFQSV